MRQHSTNRWVGSWVGGQQAWGFLGGGTKSLSLTASALGEEEEEEEGVDVVL